MALYLCDKYLNFEHVTLALIYNNEDEASTEHRAADLLFKTSPLTAGILIPSHPTNFFSIKRLKARQHLDFYGENSV